jgi:hypothetical protein
MHHLFVVVRFHFEVFTIRMQVAALPYCVPRVIGGGAAGKACALFAAWWTGYACESRELQVLKLAPF